MPVFATHRKEPEAAVAMGNRPAAFRGAGGGRCGASRWAAGCAALALLSALAGCGAVATVGSTVYSTSEAIATVVKDKMKERDGGATETPGGPDRGEK